MTVGREALVAWILLTAPVHAGGPFDGRWTADMSACTSERSLAFPVTVTPLSVSWPGAFCAVGTSYLVRDVWHIGAKCWGEGTFSAVPISLQVRGDRLMFEWGGAMQEELRRCP
jgi:hypothetical protein